jgi:hypothetical protein
MNGHNIIPLPVHRRALPAHSADRSVSRANEAAGLLSELSRTKRLAKADQRTLIANIGAMVAGVDAENAKSIAKRILEPNEWEKRKRYIRFPHEAEVTQRPNAASGGAFARIIERLVDVRARPGVELLHTKYETVRKALKGTSFLPPSPFRMPEGIEQGDIAPFVNSMDKVFRRLAEQSDLAEFLTLLSKHPIFPIDAWFQWTRELHFCPELEPLELHKWGWDSDDDDFQEWVPWWAPKCVIGHLYVPFQCQRLNIPEDRVADTRRQFGEISRYSHNDYSALLDFGEQYTTHSTVWHRLPIWIAAMALSDRITPCLYVATSLPGGFYPNQEFPAEGDPIRPCFVRAVGETLDRDAIFLSSNDSDDLNSLYACVSDTGISGIGSLIDRDIEGSFTCEVSFITTWRDLPAWLREHPVQRFLQLTAESDAMSGFAMRPRKFCGKKWVSADATIFRPAFADDPGQFTGLRQDTIAAYLLRNLASAGTQTIFEALRDDALAKYAAARGVLSGKMSIFQRAFDNKYDK